MERRTRSQVELHLIVAENPAAHCGLVGVYRQTRIEPVTSVREVPQS